MHSYISNKDLIKFASKQPNFVTHYNYGDSSDLEIFQIIDFSINERNWCPTMKLVTNFLKNVSSVRFYIDDSPIEKECPNLEDYIDDTLNIKIIYSLKSSVIETLNYQYFKEVISLICKNLTIGKLKEIDYKIQVELLDSSNLKLESIESELITTKTEKIPYINRVFTSDNEYNNYKCWVIPRILPKDLIEEYTKEIIREFFRVISEKTISENEFLLKLDDIRTIEIEEKLKVSKEQIIQIYETVDYVFGDRDYVQKLIILRHKLSQIFLEGYNLSSIPWWRVLQATRDNYFYYMNNSIEKYEEKIQSLKTETDNIIVDIASEITDVTGEIQKTIITFISIIITTFILKKNTDTDTYVILIGAIIYIGISIYLEFLSSTKNLEEIMEKRIENLKKDVQDYYLSDSKKTILSDIDNQTKDPLNNLSKLINFKRILLWALLVISIYFLIE
ncbi:hypothetical protein [Ligilactobacillus agilis]|uniref:hypothetical protein n=1 Tax=Ligilactobacillus agilis TaxID=1601 RepID=UPI001437C350|nr:hypothetical protein [Ligilactobacillus agilis]GET19268.1 hypothetical protein PTL465_15860 [Ligilactobacillus agilis]